jgi:hypothetical protein
MCNIGCGASVASELLLLREHKVTFPRKETAKKRNSVTETNTEIKAFARCHLHAKFVYK